jgi:mRNA-degrading endonuclease RelE of RelBE toxin-antitoxin system
VTERPWRLVLAAPAVRDLEALPEKAATAVVAAFEAIAESPRRVGKPLRFELEGLWSARRGPYRVLYRLDDEERLVTVVAVGHRADVYRPR